MVLGFASLHHDLKAGQVQLAQGALIHDGVAGHAAQLLAVDGKVLGAGRDAVLLDAADIACGHLARQIGVLREILEVAAAQRAALDVQAGTQQHRDLLCCGLFAYGLADGLAQGGVPAVGHGGRSREAGGRHTGVQAQVVCRTGLLAHTVGAIRQGDGRDALARQGAGVEHRAAGQQRTFLLQTQAVDDICVFHGSLLTIKKRGAGVCPPPLLFLCVDQTVFTSSFFLRKRRIVRTTRTAIRPPQTPSTA